MRRGEAERRGWRYVLITSEIVWPAQEPAIATQDMDAMEIEITAVC
jgi:hypothetical protein